MREKEAFDGILSALERGRLGHALLLVGDTRGAAARLAERLLLRLFCSAPDKPCGRCDPCRQVSERTWCDAVWVAPEKKSRVISVGQVRDRLLYAAGRTSLAGGWKAGVILGADRMHEAAANAFLKMLEEPPPRTIFLLLTDSPHLLLPTIVSRCQRLDVSDDTPRLLEEPWRGRVLNLLAADVPQGPLPAMAAAAGLCAVLEDLSAEARKRVEAESRQEASDGLDEEDDVLDARVSARYREMRADVLRTLAHWYRDLLVLRAGGDDAVLQNRDHAAVLRARAQQLTMAQALANVSGIGELGRQLESSLPEKALLAYWMDRLASGVRPAAAAVR